MRRWLTRLAAGVLFGGGLFLIAGGAGDDALVPGDRAAGGNPDALLAE